MFYRVLLDKIFEKVFDWINKVFVILVDICDIGCLSDLI